MLSGRHADISTIACKQCLIDDSLCNLDKDVLQLLCL